MGALAASDADEHPSYFRHLICTSLHAAMPSHPNNNNIINKRMASSTEKLKAAILIVSQTAFEDPSTDKAIPILKEIFATEGAGQWDVAAADIVPDDVLSIQRKVQEWADQEEKMNLVVTSGGTGFATKDVTPEVCLLRGSRRAVSFGLHRSLLFQIDGIKLISLQAVTPLLHRHAPGLV